jgi:mono/diheme cytochrome c family protein
VRALPLHALALAGLVASCSGADLIADHPCPPGGTAHTYETFGREFFATHCGSCHGGTNGYSSRAFNTLENIRAQRDNIFKNAADGNTAMPPGPDGIPAAERQALGDWLACGAP